MSYTAIKFAAKLARCYHVVSRRDDAPPPRRRDQHRRLRNLLLGRSAGAAAHAAGMRTAAIDWPATRNARTLHFSLPFFKEQHVFERRTARAVWDELTALGYPMDRQGEWAQLPKRFLKDAMVASVAAHVVHRHAPDLLLVHFLCVDSLQHLHGPRSPEAYWALEYVDGLIGRFLGGLSGETTVFVVSDH